MSRPRKLSTQATKVLLALMEQPQAWHYGYELSKQTGLASGTLYPLLMRLSEQGCLDAEWRPSLHPGRPARHAYRLNAFGMEVSANLQRELPAAFRGPRQAPA